ncbi:hypothetical protein DFH29DRAFT_353406 [Suillus ampliporus]|nr:hypothetical protein DFH29DRAFT_353406 [Suillus ampliporus]
MVSLLPYLTGLMQHTVVQLSECSPLHTQHQSVFQERMNCAMMLSLFALVDLTSRAKDTETDPPFRPHTLATVMRLLRFVILVDNTLSAQTVISPCPDLDAPRVVLVLWRHFVPWTWRLLTECNGSDSEIIIFLVRVPYSSLGLPLMRVDDYMASLRFRLGSSDYYIYIGDLYW